MFHPPPGLTTAAAPITSFDALFGNVQQVPNQRISRFACLPYLVDVDEGKPSAGRYEANIIPASAPELLAARARTHRQTADVVQVSGPEASYPYRNRSGRRLPAGRVNVDEAEVLARLTSISDDAVATEYAAAKRQDANQLFNRRPIAQCHMPHEQIVDMVWSDFDKVAGRRDPEQAEPEDDGESEREDTEDEEKASELREKKAEESELREKVRPLDKKHKRLALNHRFSTKTIDAERGVKTVRTILAADAATPCANREALVSAIENRGIANSRLPQAPTLVSVETSPKGSRPQHRPDFELYIPGERTQPKMPAAIPQIRDFGDVEDQIGSGDPSDAHSAFGEDPSPASTGQRSIVGAETTVTSDKTPRLAGPSGRRHGGHLRRIRERSARPPSHAEAR
jgi:hypothetical protein